MHIRSLEEAQKYLEDHIRMDVFTRYDADKHLKTPLERIEYFLHLLGDPHKKYPSIQVTGTSGKGSTAYFISHILAEAGYTSGFTLSPHLQKPNERLQINNEEASDQEFIEVLNDVIPAIEKMTKEPIGKPSYFEILMAMAFVYFAKKEVDIVVAEVGLEGKYDGTNILDPLVVVLTNISLDHTAILGDTVEKIAVEAVSAIKKQEVPSLVITGKLQDSVREIVHKEALEAGSKIIEYGVGFSSAIEERTPSQTVFRFKDAQGEIRDIHLPMKGDYQVDNASLAIEAIRNLPGFPVSVESVHKALGTSFFPGRFEEFQYQERTVVIDGAHNDAKMASFLHALEEYYPSQRKVFIVGFKRDKNIQGMLEHILPHADEMIVTHFQKTTDQSKDFSMPSEQVKSFISPSLLEKKKVQVAESSLEALNLAIASDSENVIVITGSLYLIGEIREFLTEQS